MSGGSLKGGKSKIVDWFRENDSSLDRILDIGAGSGTYINLIKYKENLCQHAEWVAIEAWHEYIEKYKLDDKYHKVINTDVRKFAWSENFSVAIAGDVLEHMSKEDAIQLVDDILLHCGTLIISIPVVHMPQDEIDGNPFEVHIKDDWTHGEVMGTWEKYIKSYYKKGAKSKIGVYWLTK